MGFRWVLLLCAAAGVATTSARFLGNSNGPAEQSNTPPVGLRETERSKRLTRDMQKAQGGHGEAASPEKVQEGHGEAAPSEKAKDGHGDQPREEHHERNTTGGTSRRPHPCNSLATWYEGSPVEQMCWSTSETFPPSEGTWFIEFYAPWCPLCRDFKQNWISFAGNGVETLGKVGAVDCTLQEQVCRHYGIKVYPTLKAYYKGAWSDEVVDGAVGGLEIQAWAQRVVSGMIYNNSIVPIPRFKLRQPEEVADTNSSKASSQPQKAWCLAPLAADAEEAQFERAVEEDDALSNGSR